MKSKSQHNHLWRNYGCLCTALNEHKWEINCYNNYVVPDLTYSSLKLSKIDKLFTFGNCPGGLETTIGGQVNIDPALALATLGVVHYHATSENDVVYNKIAVRLIARHSTSSGKSALFFLLRLLQPLVIPHVHNTFQLTKLYWFL